VTGDAGGNEEPVLRTQYLWVNHATKNGSGVVLAIHQSGKRGGGGQDTDGQHDTLGRSS
jgi:hypothetical protein